MKLIFEENLNDPKIIYILGFLWGDGYVARQKNSYSITINNITEDVNDIISLFDPSDWKTYNLFPKNKKPITMIRNYNKQNYEFLLKNDYVSKSFLSADKILNIIPDNLKHYWFRGLSDADGYFKLSNIKGGKSCLFEIYSDIKQDWSFLENLCNNLDIKKYKIVRRRRITGNYSSFLICNLSETVKILNYIYSGESFGFYRKRNRYLEIINYWEEKHKPNFKIISPNEIFYAVSLWSFSQEIKVSLSVLIKILNKKPTKLLRGWEILPL